MILNVLKVYISILGEVQRQRKFRSEFLKEGYPNLLLVPPG